RYAWWVRLAAMVSLPLILYGNHETDSRSGMVATLSGALAYVLFLGIKRWKSKKNDLLGPAIVTAYPVGAVGTVLLSFFWIRLRRIFWGGGSEEASNAGRSEEFRKGIPKILENPLGYGDGMSGSTIQVMGVYGSYTVDSYYLTLAVEYGIAGLVVWVST